MRYHKGLYNENMTLFHNQAEARGEVFWHEGFSEPQAGLDLVEVQLKAIEDEGGFLLNGQKLWTSDKLFEVLWDLDYAAMRKLNQQPSSERRVPTGILRHRTQ